MWSPRLYPLAQRVRVTDLINVVRKVEIALHIRIEPCRITNLPEDAIFYHLIDLGLYCLFSKTKFPL